MLRQPTGGKKHAAECELLEHESCVLLRRASYCRDRAVLEVWRRSNLHPSLSRLHEPTVHKYLLNLPQVGYIASRVATHHYHVCTHSRRNRADVGHP